MSNTIHYISIFVFLFIVTSSVLGDAFDQTINQIKSIETDLEQNKMDIEEKLTFIEEELKAYRANHELNKPKGEFESDADYTARINRLNAAVTQRRNELENEHLTDLQTQQLVIKTEIMRLSRRHFYTNDVMATLGRYNANSEYFPILFEVNNQRVSVRLYISRHDYAPTLKDNWDKVLKTAYISIDPGYRRALIRVKLEYTPLWKYGVSWQFIDLYNLGDVPNAVAFSPDGKYIATGLTRRVKRDSFSFYVRGSASIWDFNNGKELRNIKHTYSVNSVSFSPNGQYLATGDYRWINLWNISNENNIWSRRHGDRINILSVAFSPYGRHLVTVSRRSIIVFRISDGSLVWSSSSSGSGFRSANFYTTAYSPNGKFLATGDSFNDAIIWNASEGTIIHTIKHTGDILSVAFSPDGQFLATGDVYANLSICDVNSGIKVVTKELLLNNYRMQINAITYSPDGQFLAVHLNRTLLGSNSTRRYIYIYRIPETPITIHSSLHLDSIIGLSGEITSDRPELAWHPNGAFITDGNMVYRIPTYSEQFSLTPPDPTLHTTKIDTVNAGTQFTLDLNINKAFDLAGWQLDISFNSSVLSVAKVSEGNFLKVRNGSTFFQGGNIDNTTGKVTGLSSVLIGDNGISGAGSLLSLTFEANSAGDVNLQLLNTILTNSSGEVITHEIDIHPITIVEGFLPEDVNQDKVVNIQDLVIVASSFGQTGENNADVNEDGVVNIQDLVLVASAFGNSASAPALFSQATEMLSTTDIKQWLSQAQQLQLNLTDPALQRGILFLEQLLAALTPQETALLPNYPNPFNPETWIPYQLATPANVSISIYAADGKLVRSLDLGHQEVGIYKSQSQAAYWDGKNHNGEPVASGVYFYTLTADKFTATRKMLIRK